MIAEIDFLHVIIDPDDDDTPREWIDTGIPTAIADGPYSELVIALPFRSLDDAIATLRTVLDDLEHRKGET